MQDIENKTDIEIKPTIKKKNKGQFLNILINVVIPSVILTKYSGDNYLGQFYGLILALMFPIVYGAYEFISTKKINFFSGIGLFSVILTGGIGLFELNRNWMVAKETGIPLLMGIIVILSQLFNYSFVRTFLNQVIDIELIDNAFSTKGLSDLFEKKITHAAYLLGGTFFISAILNYILAKKYLIGQPGTVEFNEGLGKMTAISFPVISVPMTIMVGLIIYYLIHAIKEHTELETEQIFRQ